MVGYIFGYFGFGYFVFGEVFGSKLGVVDVSGEVVIIIDKLEVGFFDVIS